VEEVLAVLTQEFILREDAGSPVAPRGLRFQIENRSVSPEILRLRAG
jgi:hypothetical protein